MTRKTKLQNFLQNLEFNEPFKIESFEDDLSFVGPNKVYQQNKL